MPVGVCEFPKNVTTLNKNEKNKTFMIQIFAKVIQKNDNYKKSFIFAKNFKKMKKIFVIILASFFAQSSLFSQDWLWGTSISGIDALETEGVGIDSSNNIYLLNELNGTSVVQGNTVVSVGNKDLQLSKFNINGALQWTRGMGGIDTDDPKGLFTDKNGNSYMTGSFVGSANFSTITINAQNDKDAFLAKYDAYGNVIWAKDIAWGENLEKGTSVSVDDLGYISVLGFFKDTIIFGDTVGAANSDTLIALKNSKNYFYAKFDNNGAYIYSKLIYSNSKHLTINYLTLHDGAAYYIGGYFTDSLFIDNDTIVAKQHSRDIGIINLDAFGNVVWTKGFGDDNLDELNGIESDENGNIYITGAFQDSLMFDNDTIYGTNATNYDLFVAKLDPSGNELWATAKGDVQDDYGWSVTYQDSKLQISGSFSGIIIWGSDTISRSSINDLDAFFATLDVNTGNLINLIKVHPGGPLIANDEPRDIVVDNFGNTYMAGRYASDYLYFGDDTITNANPGQYDVFLAKYGCQEIYLNFVIDSITCPGMNDGAATVTPTILNPFDYLWSTGDTTNTIDSLVEGTYTVTLSTPWGCAYSDSVVVTHYASLTTYMDNDTVTLNCVADTNGIAIITPVNGVDSGYTYTWDNGVLDSMVTNLDTGLHYVTVSDYCGSVVDSVFVTHLPTLQETTYPHAIILLCQNSTDGEATVNASLGYGSYQYQWDNGDTTATTYSLDQGVHYVTVSDGCNVPQIDSVKVNYLPPMHVSIIDDQPANCINSSDGSAYVEAISGVPPYTYLWDNGDTTAQTNTLDTGITYVTVSDYCGAVVDSIAITSKPPLTMSVSSVADADCPTSTNGAAMVSTNNGAPPFTYAWSNSTDTDSLASDLPVGITYVSVTDQCGTVIDSVNISNKPPLSISVSQTQLVTCPGDSDGAALVTTLDGVQPFTYAWYNSTDTDSLASDLPVGVTYVSVTDQCGTAIDSVELTATTPLNITTQATDINCYGDSTGQILIHASAGVLPYSYSWSCDTTLHDSLATGLVAGTYFVTVADNCGSLTDTITLTQSDAIQFSVDITNATTNLEPDGAIDLSVMGGTSPYDFVWSNGEPSEDISGLSNGTYRVTVTDMNNCFAIDTIDVEADSYGIIIYNSFSPNADGVNDLWNIKNIGYYPDCKVQIFNEWGNLVFTSDGYKMPWDGTNNGKVLPAGTYYYIIDLGTNDKPLTGPVTLIK